MKTAANITIRPARHEEASQIARLIMVAMNHDCCRYFCGEGHGLDDFHRMMTRLVEREDSQYSYRNTLVAEAPLEGRQTSTIAGILVSYDGGELHRLRRAFIEAALQDLEKDHSDMDDETQAGELYLDSLAVSEGYRHQGIATMLLKAAPIRARQLYINKVGLLVDQGNPSAEHLYRQLGFRFENETTWGGHPMRHLVMDC